MKFNLFLLFIFLYSFGFGQKLTENKKASLYFDKAYKYYLSGDTANSKIYCLKSIKKDSLYTEPYVLEAQIFAEQKRYKKAIILLKKVIYISVEYKDVYFILSNYLISNNQFQQAIFYLNKYIFIEKDKIKIDKANHLIAICDFRISALNNPVKFFPTRLSEKINTKKSEYFPTISADNNSIIFTRLIGNSNHLQEDIFVYDKLNDKIQNISKNINTANNEGASTISTDGKIIIFTRCTPMNGCDLFVSTKDNSGKWSKAVKLPAPINSKYWESQPSLSPNNKTLYFVSNRKGGKGKMDIWSSVFLGNTIWSKPINLGDSINTPGNEMSPFIHFDNKTLYFSSDYHLGMGKFDVFKSTKINDSTWTKPKNLGYPINTKEDEYRLVVTPDGKTGYFSSERDTVYKQDIFSLQLDSNIQPERTIFLKVIVFNESGNKKINADKISVINLENLDTSFISYNESEFITCLSVEEDYSLNVLKKGYMFNSNNFSLKKLNDSVKIYSIKILLQPIKVDEKVILKNVFFETDSYQINPKSYPELYKFVEFLKVNSLLHIQINGHTDNIGSKEYNNLLSEKRAKEIKKFLINNGIASQRIDYKGFGYSRPIANNKTEKGRKHNRRTEIIILKK